MVDVIPCPYHGDQPAVADVDGFTSCRRCWYREWLYACLFYGRRGG